MPLEHNFVSRGHLFDAFPANGTAIGEVNATAFRVVGADIHVISMTGTSPTALISLEGRSSQRAPWTTMAATSALAVFPATAFLEHNEFNGDNPFAYVRVLVTWGGTPTTCVMEIDAYFN